MYEWLWRKMPGDVLSIKAIWLALVMIALIALLWFLVFPWATIHLPIDQA